MMIDRRTLLAAASGFVLSPAFAEKAPPVLAAYERETGGRIRRRSSKPSLRKWDGWWAGNWASAHRQGEQSAVALAGATRNREHAGLGTWRVLMSRRDRSRQRRAHRRHNKE